MNHIFIGKNIFIKTHCFRIHAVFEANNEKDYSNITNKRTNIYKRNPIMKGYHIKSELEDVLKSNFYKSPLG